MKRSKPWLMFILIASVLLLSGVRSACDEPRNNKQTNQIETGSHQHHASGNPIATPINQKNPDATPTETPAETYNYYGHFNYVPARRIQSGGFWVVAGQVAYVASAVLVAIFTGALVVISRYQWNVAQQSADAAKQSAVAATTTANVLIGAESAYLDITYTSDLRPSPLARRVSVRGARRAFGRIGCARIGRWSRP